MDDKDFFAECIKRIISAPLRTKTDIQMTNIILRNTAVDYSDMFEDKAVDELFGNKLGDNRETISSYSYKFIRDNQDLYVNSKNMDYHQVNKILEDINLQNILNSQKFSDEDSKLILNESIYRLKFNVIQHFMEKGIMPSTDTAFFIESLARKSSDLEMLKYVESKGVDLVKIGSGRLIKSTTLNNNYEGLIHIIDKAPNDMQIIRQSVDAYIRKEYDVILSTRRREEKLFEITQKMSPIIRILLSKLSVQNVEFVKMNLKYDEMKEFIDKEYLGVSLQEELTTNHASNNRMKI